MKTNFIVVALIVVASSCTVQPDRNIIHLNEIRGKSHVTVKFGGVVIPDILIDTGFAFDGLMVYNPDYKDSLDLTNAQEVRIGGAGSGDPSTASMIDSAEFYLGDIKMSNQRFILLQGDTYKGFPSNGIIGYSIFGHYAPEFNYDDNTMTLHAPAAYETDNSWSEIPIYFKDNNIPWIDVSVVIEDEDPILISAYIDYAAGDAILLLEKANMKFQLPKDTKSVPIGRGLSGDIYGKKGSISKLIIGPHELNNVEASVAAAEVRSKQDGADAILGIGSLRRFNMIFDYANKKLFIKPNKHYYEDQR